MVARCWYFYHRNRQIWSYFFDTRELLDTYDIWDADKNVVIQKSTQRDPNDLVILDLLQAKSEYFLQTWRSLSEDRSRHITPDIVQILTSFCMTVALYTACLSEKPDPRLQILQSNSHSLWEGICSLSASRESAFIFSSLLLFPVFLPLDSSFSKPTTVAHQALYGLVAPLTQILEGNRRSHKDTLSVINEESMDPDDPFSASTDQIEEVSNIMSANRNDLPLFQDSASFQRYMTIFFSIFQMAYASLFQPQELLGETLGHYLSSLDEVDLLGAHELLPYVYKSCAEMDRNSLLGLLEDLGEKCLQSYELERCENSHLICIRMMDSLATSWTSGIQDSLNDSAADIYTWFTEVFLKKGRASSSVLISFAELLGDILRLNPAYSSVPSSPSPRTTLFKIVEDGDVLVKFNAGKLFPQLLGQFPLKDHDAIFSDVLGCLPTDPGWEEGIAVRLYLLAQLASKWHTLLRRSIYHIFETPAHLSHSLWYAEKCLRYVSDALGLQDAKEIFRLFSSQIIYTWTEEQSVTSMPFSIFGYTKLNDMLCDAQDEIVGQIMMRASDQDAADFSRTMQRPLSELLTGSFHKAEAYAISRDISTPPGQGSQPKGVENRLKKILGSGKFMTLVEAHFPQIIATFFGSLDLYEQVEKAFSRRESFQSALTTYRHISCKGPARTLVLPANQQPAFRARYLIDELEFLCKRTGYELETIWTPTLACYVCRTLLESIHSALGSLHACSVLRKIKVLVCIAGPVMLSDYPLEMLLHALQPFLVDAYCAEDALAIFQYLLEAGNAYLVEQPGLLADIAVSTSLLLRNFLASPPTSIRQEGQFQTVAGNLQTFYREFEEYLNAYTSPVLDEESSQTFRRLTACLKTVVQQEPSSNGVTESDLLLEVFKDRTSKSRLLSKPISDRLISMLCTTEAPGYHLAAFERDEDAICNATTVCQTLRDFEPAPEYRSWAARVIGRAFAVTGHISDTLTREQDLTLVCPSWPQANIDTFCRSKANILQILCNLLLSSGRTGTVERTLQLIVSSLTNFPGFELCADEIPPSLMKALTWSPYQCPRVSLSTLEAKERDSVQGWALNLSFSIWSRNIGLFLSKTATEDPVLGPLDSVLYLIPGLAAQLLPYILHDALLAEFRGEVSIRESVSQTFNEALQDDEDHTIPHARLVISCILYLRNQPRPEEQTIVERETWLDIDYAVASSAASRCRLPKAALMFLEIHASRSTSGSRRSSVAKFEPPAGLLHDIFKSIDDPDFFYGIPKSSSLESIMETLEHESSGFKNLLFQSAQYDSEVQMTGSGSTYGVLQALNSTNLQGIANSMLGALGNSSDATVPYGSVLKAATNLRQWDIPVSTLSSSPSTTIFRAFQSLNTSSTLIDIRSSIDEGFANSLALVDSDRRSETSLRTAMRTLGILTEIEEVLNSKSTEGLSETWKRISGRTSWLQTTKYV